MFIYLLCVTYETKETIYELVCRFLAHVPCITGLRQANEVVAFNPLTYSIVQGKRRRMEWMLWVKVIMMTWMA